jgi:multidrug efflux pump subunit AcrB
MSGTASGASPTGLQTWASPAAVLLLIYILVVGWFQSFITPIGIMAAIPFSLVGILPAHAAMGAFFTATSMIGFIAGAGIVVRNSIILVDFIELRLREGMPLADAVIDAGAVRFRPMARRPLPWSSARPSFSSTRSSRGWPSR